MKYPIVLLLCLKFLYSTNIYDCLQEDYLVSKKKYPNSELLGLFEKTIATKNPNHLYDLGYFFATDSVNKDFEKAFAYIQQAALSGVPQAQYYVGRTFELGGWITAEIRRGYPMCLPFSLNQFDTSFFRCEEKSIQNLDSAMYWYKKCYENGAVKGKTGIARIYYHHLFGGFNPLKATELFKEAATEGCGKAQYWLADNYWYGKILEKSLDSAEYWANRAIFSGNSDGYAVLGLVKVERYNKNIIKYYKLGYELGSMSSMFQYALCLDNGYGIDKDSTHALALFNEACLKGYNDACLELSGKYYAHDKDSLNCLSFDYAMNAFNSGNLSAALIIGNLYYFGLCKEKDVTNALYYFNFLKYLDNPELLISKAIMLIASNSEEQILVAKELLHKVSSQNRNSEAKTKAIEMLKYIDDSLDIIE